MSEFLHASDEDPFVFDIARIRKAGELDALRAGIARRKHYFATEAWNNTDSSGTCKKLGLAITRAEKKLKEMRMLLAEIHNLDPNND